MTLIEFIKSKLSEDSPIGDLAKDIQGDSEFPIDESEDEIISYIKFRTTTRENSLVLIELLNEYKQYREKETDDIDAKFSILKTETWSFYKEHFTFDKVILVGKSTDIYKVYCVDSSTKRALFFDLKSEKSLNDISLRETDTIHIGNLTTQTNIETAIKLLEDCPYDDLNKPNVKTFNELLSFMKKNIQ